MRSEYAVQKYVGQQVFSLGVDWVTEDRVKYLKKIESYLENELNEFDTGPIFWLETPIEKMLDLYEAVSDEGKVRKILKVIKGMPVVSSFSNFSNNVEKYLNESLIIELDMEPLDYAKKYFVGRSEDQLMRSYSEACLNNQIDTYKFETFNAIVHRV